MVLNILTTLAVLCAPQARHEPEMPLRERLIGSIPEGFDSADAFPTSGLDRWVLRYGGPSGKRIDVGDWQSATFDAFRWFYPTPWTPDEKHFWFTGRRGKKFFFVYAGTSYGPYDRYPLVSFREDDGAPWYVACVGEKYHLVANGTPSEPFDDVREEASFMTRSGPVYQATARGKEFVVAANRRGMEYEYISSLGVGPDGTCAYVGTETKGRVWVHLGERRLGPFAWACVGIWPDGTLAYAADGTLSIGERKVREGLNRSRNLKCSSAGVVIYVSEKTGGTTPKVMVVADGVAGPDFDSVDTVRFTADGKTPYYEGRRGGKSVLMYGGRELGTFDSIVNFGSDVRKIPAFWGFREGAQFVIVGDKVLGEGRFILGRQPDDLARVWVERVGKEDVLRWGERVLGTHESIKEATYAPGGGSFAYSMKKLGQWYVMHDGEIRGEGAEDISDLLLSRNRALAYSVKREGTWRIHVGGPQRAGPFDKVSNLRFSNDGKKLGFAAFTGREVWWRVIDCP